MNAAASSEGVGPILPSAVVPSAVGRARHPSAITRSPSRRIAPPSRSTPPCSSRTRTLAEHPEAPQISHAAATPHVSASGAAPRPARVPHSACASLAAHAWLHDSAVRPPSRRRARTPRPKHRVLRSCSSRRSRGGSPHARLQRRPVGVLAEARRSKGQGGCRVCGTRRTAYASGSLTPRPAPPPPPSRWRGCCSSSVR